MAADPMTIMSIDDATLPNSATASHEPAKPARGIFDGPETVLAALIVGMSGVIFAFDVVTPADHVSVSFLYAIPLFVAIYGRAQPVYLYAALGTALSMLGIFIQPPEDVLPASFYANRAIAVTALWIVAGFVATRRKAEALVRAGLKDEKRKSEYRRRFLDVLSHEIGTSLTAIDGHAFRLRKLAGGVPAIDVVARADKIRNAVRHIETLVRRVQLASEAGQRALHPRIAAFDLRALIGEVVQRLREAGEGERIETDLGGLPERVQADCYMLQHVMENLLSNAVKYSSPGTPIRVVGRTAPGHVEIAVIDRGRGVPQDEQTMLFSPYYRASNSRGIHGAGIGLYVCERFVTSHGGTIEMQSELGAGSIITVRLPIEAHSPSRNNAETAHPVH